MRTIDNDNTKQTTFSEFNNKNVVNAAISGHQPTTIRQYKDNVFCLLYRDKNNLLDLYNGLNDTNYTNVDDLTVTTLKGGVYMKYKNDASFVFGQDLYMFEQQSSRNPNICTIYLMYIGRCITIVICTEVQCLKFQYHILLLFIMVNSRLKWKVLFDYRICMRRKWIVRSWNLL